MHIVPNSSNLGGLERGLLNLLHRMDADPVSTPWCAQWELWVRWEISSRLIACLGSV